MDVAKDSIAVAVLSPDRDVAEVDKIFHDTDSVRRLIKRLGKPKGIWACYEAGPTGYDLQRLLTSMGVRCDVVAPSLIPKGSGDRVKTDRRDARRLAGLHRAGELTPIAIPTPAQEGVRDLCRTRGDMVQDLTRARNRLSGFLLRHSVVWRGGSPWTERHRRWLATLTFDDPAIATTYAHYLATVKLRDTALESVEADLVPWCTQDPFGDQVPRLAAYRGVTRIGALCLAAEVFDWRRFPRARALHELHRPRARRELDGSDPTSGLDHPGRQRPPAGPALRSGLGLSAQPERRSRHQRAPTRRPTRDRGPLVGRAGPTVQAVPPTRRPQERALGRRCRDRPRARRVPLGRDGGRGLTLIFPSLSARSAPRLSEPSTTRRSTAAADPILAGVTPSIVLVRVSRAPLFRGNYLRMALLRF